MKKNIEFIIFILDSTGPIIFVFLIISLFLIVYPHIYIKFKFLRDVEFIANIYRNLMLRGFYIKRLRDYYKDKFNFRHYLLGEDLINYDKIKDFEELYQKPTFTTREKSHIRKRFSISTNNFLKKIEKDPVLFQLDFIEGKAGYGKTNLLIYIGSLAYHEKITIKSALLINIKDIEAYFNEDESSLKLKEKFLKHSNGTLCSALHYCYRDQGFKISLCDIYYTIRHNCILLLDGFDEILNVNDANKLISRIRKFRSEFPKLKIIISGRPGSFPKPTTESPHDDNYFKINGLSKNEILSLIKKTIGVISEGKNDSYMNRYFNLSNRILMNRSIYDMAKIPFLLTLIILLGSNSRKLPEHRDELIKSSIMLAIELKLNGYGNGLADALLNVLCKISFDEVNNSVDKTSIIEYIDSEFSTISFSMFDDSKGVIEYLRKSGLLIHTSNRFEFTHKSIKDYLCALYLFRKLDKRPEEIKKYNLFFEKTNFDVVFFYCCFIKDASIIFLLFVELELYDTCLELMAWNSLNSNLKIIDKNIEYFWSVLERKKDRKFITRAQLYLKLIRLKCCDAFTEKAITVDEYELVSDRLPKKNIRYNYVVGLDINEIKNFYTNLNNIFCDDIIEINESNKSGEFKPVSHVNRNNEFIGSDTVVINDKNEYEIALPRSKRFDLIEKKIFEKLKKYVNMVTKNIGRKILIHDISALNERLCCDIMECFDSCIILNKVVEKNIMCTEKKYLELREMLFNTDISSRDQLIRSGSINYSLLFLNKLDKDDSKVFVYFRENLLHCIDCDESFVELSLAASMFEIINSIFMEYKPNKYNFAKKIFIKVFLNYLASNEEIHLWGRLKVQYTLDDEDNPYIN